jgi:hypothetical protein
MITVATILHAFVCVGVGLTAHILWWRRRRPQDDVKALLACLVIGPAALALGYTAFAQGPSASGGLAWGSGCLTALLAAFLGMCYVISYPGAQAASPTMLILLQAARSGEQGIRPPELMDALDEKMLCDNILTSLVHEEFAHAVNGQLVPAWRGRRMVKICQAWRALLGLQEGEG